MSKILYYEFCKLIFIFDDICTYSFREIGLRVRYRAEFFYFGAQTRRLFSRTNRSEIQLRPAGFAPNCQDPILKISFRKVTGMHLRCSGCVFKH